MLEDLLDPIANEDPTWHARFLIYVDVIKEGPHVFRSALKRVYELSPTPDGKLMPNSWYEKAKEFHWESRAQKYLLARAKERLCAERKKIISETERNLSDILNLEFSERYKRIKASATLSNAFLVYVNVLEESAMKYQQDWLEQLADIKTHVGVLRNIGEAIAKVSTYQPQDFEAGKNNNEHNDVEFELD
jgi:hypothetical protein